MADALISPAVGGTMWVASAGLAAWSVRKLRTEITDRKAPLMGVLGAFVFAAQMINFSIPGTGSSGHLGGGMILAILLGPHAAFLAMFSILAVQALFFADGGLLALGCNVFNLGFWPCFVAYPLIFRPLARAGAGRARIAAGATLTAVVGLQLGAFGVVLQTLLSGISELPFGAFLLLMQPIHLAIGIVEGAVTAALVTFVWKARPELVEYQVARPLRCEGEDASAAVGAVRPGSLRPVLVFLGVLTVIVGGALSWFASTHPDGLEWAMGRVSGKEEMEPPAGGIHERLAGIQEKTAFLPDYGFKAPEPEPGPQPVAGSEAGGEEPEPWPAVSAGTTVSGLVGALIVLVLAGAVGLVLRRTRRAERSGG